MHSWWEFVDTCLVISRCLMQSNTSFISFVCSTLAMHIVALVSVSTGPKEDVEMLLGPQVNPKVSGEEFRVGKL